MWNSVILVSVSGLEYFDFKLIVICRICKEVFKIVWVLLYVNICFESYSIVFSLEKF